MNYNISHINAFHVLVVGALLAYIGKKKNNTHKYVYYLLGIATLLIPLSISLPSFDLNYWNIIKLLHYLVFLPGLLYLTYYQKFSEETYNNLFISGIVIIVYHLYKLSGRYERLFN
jgi:Ca2+/Na+ antiporter